MSDKVNAHLKKKFKTNNEVYLHMEMSLEDLRQFWSDASDASRMEIIKSVIFTHPNMHQFYAKVVKMLKSNAFQGELD